ncbi:substrate-binding domain-containing protein, partial [Streptomyces ipomoeae]
EASSFLPPLTTIHQDFAEVGRLCVQGVLSKMRQDMPEHGTTLVPTRLVPRHSTAPPPPRRDVTGGGSEASDEALETMAPRGSRRAAPAPDDH